MRQLTAIMFTDIVGFTALMQQNEARAKAIVLRHREVVSERVEGHDGDLLQFYGDGTLSVFKSAVQAVDCAIAIQRSMSGPEGAPLRIGLHTGDVIHESGSVYGDGINVASRIQGLGVPGAVLVSGKLADEVKNHPHIETCPLGEFALKNLTEPIRVLAVVGDGLALPAPHDLDSEPETHRASVAVLPFVNLSSDPENEFFADGITEEVINVLTRVEGLKVTARTSSFTFKGRSEDVRAIGQQLGVDTVLEGSVRKAGSRVRVTAQLVDTNEGYHLFSENYDGDLEDIFATQDKIALAIVSQLQGSFDGAPEPASLVSNETKNSEAYLEYLKGLHHWNRFTPEDQRKAIAHFKEAARLDPTWASPHAFLAACHVVLAIIGVLPPKAAYRIAEAAAKTAVRVGEGVGLAHVAQAVVHFLYHWDFEAAHESFRTALALSPGLAEARRTYGIYLTMIGDFEGGIRELEKAVELDPLAVVNLLQLARSYSLANRFDDALATAGNALHLDSSCSPAIEVKGHVLVAMGRWDDAIEAFESLPRLAGNRFEGAGSRGYVYALAGRTDAAVAMVELLEEKRKEQPSVAPYYDLALVHVGLRNDDEAVACLESAVEARTGPVLWTPVEPQWVPLRSHPGFQAILEAVGGGSRSNLTDVGT